MIFRLLLLSFHPKLNERGLSLSFLLFDFDFGYSHHFAYNLRVIPPPCTKMYF